MRKFLIAVTAIAFASIAAPVWAEEYEPAQGCVTEIKEKYSVDVGAPVSEKTSGTVFKYRFNGTDADGSEVKFECKANRRGAVLDLAKRPGQWS